MQARNSDHKNKYKDWGATKGQNSSLSIGVWQETTGVTSWPLHSFPISQPLVHETRAIPSSSNTVIASAAVTDNSSNCGPCDIWPDHSQLPVTRGLWVRGLQVTEREISLDANASGDDECSRKLKAETRQKEGGKCSCCHPESGRCDTAIHTLVLFFARLCLIVLSGMRLHRSGDCCM